MRPKWREARRAFLDRCHERWKIAHDMREEGFSYGEIGKVLGVSRERARQLVIHYQNGSAMKPYKVWAA